MAQSQSSVEKRADQAFSQKNYSEALPDYRQLLAKDPQNPKLNFCYGVCVFEVAQHFEAAKYFDVAIGLKQIPDPLLYYYRARIYQEQYFFTQAIIAYQTYQKLTLNQKAALNVHSHIEECERAQMEINQFSQLPLLSVVSTSNLKFYNAFPFDPEDFSFYEAPEVHLKNNAKHQHIPVYAYKRGMKYRILASYGPKGEQLDLYLQRKDAANNWAEPVLINGGVNGLVSDESFGFYDATTTTLYFTSTANSIGASDLYKASYDLNANVASNVERMPYPYSSPVDDLFYVTDPAQQRAYFATTRQAKVGQYEIYTLELDQPVQLRFVFSGHFFNDLEPLSKTVNLRFKRLNSQEDFGPFVSDSDGNYTVALPSSGDFELEISVAGASKVYTTRFGIPKLAPGKGLQQLLRYGADDYGQEKWQVLNQIFDLEPAEQLASLAKLQLDVAKGNLLQTSPEHSTQDTATFVSLLTDSLLAAEVSLENQVRLMDLLRQDFEKQLNARESLLAELSTLLLNSDNQDQKIQVLTTLKDVEDKLVFINRWIAINQASNIPDLVLLDTLQQLNERNQLLLHMGDTLLLVKSWQERQVSIQQYLQIAAFDGASAIAAAQLEQQLRLEQIIKEEATNKEQQRQLTQQINKLQSDQALLSKKEQAQTQLKIEALQLNLAEVSAHAEQLGIARESQAKEVEIYDQDELKALYLKESENQSLPKVDFQVTYDELLAQYAQQGLLSEQLKVDVHSNAKENGNISSTVQTSTEEPIIQETTIPEPSIEEASIPETTILEPSIEEASIPETTILEPSIEEASIPETTIPEPSISAPETIDPKNENITLENTNLTQRVNEFTQQFEALSNMNDLDINQLPVLERVGLSNKELDTLALALTLPSSKNNAAPALANNKLTTEAEIQGYINYVAERGAFEQTKETLLQNQLAIRALEENYEPAAQDTLLHLLVAQATILDQLYTQKQNLLQVANQAELEQLLQDNYKPVSNTTASTDQPAFEPASVRTTSTFQRQQIPTNLAPLPVGLPCPEGLVFRVQVGAFRKPVPAARFREFTPVDGQILANGLTVYMAGYFQSSTEALQQQKLIRTLGYTDAFVVAYQNCTRLSLAQGRALEKQVVTANTNIAVQSSKFAGPGQGLYYSVQVGVYNRPLTSEAQLGLNELIEARTAKGQYRYASGKFSNIQEAKTRQQQAVAKGITDAYIVAYYEGKRIDLAQAKLLSQSGIQFETFEKVEPQQVFTAQLQQQIQTLQIPEMKKVILPDPISRYELRCSDCPSELSRFNRVGVFIYDDQKELIISAVQKESQWDLVQQMYLKEMRKRNVSLKGPTQTLLLEQRNLDGAFMDWILRQHNGYELFRDEQGQLQLRYILPLQE